jgi:hypothetical protein
MREQNSVFVKDVKCSYRLHWQQKHFAEGLALKLR